MTFIACRDIPVDIRTQLLILTKELFAIIVENSLPQIITSIVCINDLITKITESLLKFSNNTFRSWYFLQCNIGKNLLV